MTKTYRSEYVRCGKGACKSCPHGPYWYCYERIGGKLHKSYIGKERPDLGGKTDRGPDHRRDAINSPRTATLDLAWEILGVARDSSFDVCRSAYRKLAMEHHPDRGGSHQRFVWTANAWAYLRQRHGW